jgi:predicted nuclease of predicted toxin-antitoxin system
MLLLDENISFKIVRQIVQDFPRSTHVRDIGLKNSSDFAIWEYAKQHSLTIVTFDNDFVNISLLKGWPPKIILLKSGNRSTAEITSMLLSHKAEIIDFLSLAEFELLSCLEIRQ